MSYVINREDIQISSKNPIACTRMVNSLIQDDPVNTPNALYDRYKPTAVQFLIAAQQKTDLIYITIPYANVLTELEATYARICQHDGTRWNLLVTQKDTIAKTLKTSVSMEGTIAIFLNDYWYSIYTQEIANQYPTWTHIRQSQESNGQRFFNFFGMAIERMRQDGLEIQQEKFIDLLDTQMIDWVYVYEIPALSANDTVLFYEGTQPLPILEALQDFFYNKKDGGGIIDYENRRFYSTRYYEDFHGEVTNYANRQTFQAQGVPFQIWNPFDEFGTLVGIKRLHRETNANFKERIKDVFRYPANSGEAGLINGVARELNLIKRVTWQDDTKNLYLKGTGLIPRTILVDDQPLQLNEYSVDEYGNILIQAMNRGVEHTVSFIQNIEQYELHDSQNEKLYPLIFEVDGQASSLLNKWVAYINQVAPVMWGAFNWDEGYWDTINKELTGIGYIPNIWDSSIDSWKDYTFNPKRWEGKKIWQS